MSKNDDVNPLSRLASRNHLPPPKGFPFRTCLVGVLESIAAGLLMSAFMFLFSFFLTGVQADYVRWAVSRSFVTVTICAGLLQVVGIAVRYWINRRKNRYTLPSNVITDFSEPGAADEAGTPSQKRPDLNK
jgi:hypothetical protein